MMIRISFFTFYLRQLFHLVGCGALLVCLCSSVLAQGTPVPPELKNLTDTLRKLGEGDLANQLERDIQSGRVTIGDVGARASTGVNALDRSPFTRYIFGSGTTNNYMTLNRAILGEIASGNQENIVGWALTIRHEYIHMGQWDPKANPASENPAYREFIKTGTGWYGSVKKELEEALQAPPTKENLEKVKELRTLANAVGKQMSEVFNDMHTLVNDGSLAPDQWWTLDHGRASTLEEGRNKNNEIVKNDFVKIDADIKNLAEKVAALPKDPVPPKNPKSDKDVVKDVPKDPEVKKPVVPQKTEPPTVVKETPKEKPPLPPKTETKKPPVVIPPNLNMDGTYAGSVKMLDSTGSITLTVTGDKVSGTFTEKYFKDMGPSTVSRKCSAAISGKVDLATGAIASQSAGTIHVVVTIKPTPPVKGVPDSPTPPPAVNNTQSRWNFNGSFTGAGFSGPGSSMDWPWKVTRTGASAQTAPPPPPPADKPTPPPVDVPNKGGTVTGPYGERTVLTYRQNAEGKMVPVTTEYDLNGRQVRQTTVDKNGQVVPMK